MKPCLVILDSLEYKKRECELKEALDGIAEVSFFYSKYENCITEHFAKMHCFGSFFQHIAYWLLSLWYAIILLCRFKKYETLIFINPIVGFFYSGLSRIFSNKKQISIGGFLFENKSSRFYLILRKILVNFCYKYVNNLFVYGEKEVDYYDLLFPHLCGKFKYVKYGKDFIYKDKKAFSHKESYIASGGRSNRKFETLAEAMTIIKEKNIGVDCMVATRPECISLEIENSPLKIIYGITLNQFGSFVEGALAFILPLKNISLSAGHMAMMEAMFCGRPIIVTDIPAIRDYVSEQEVFFYKPDDAVDLADKIEFVLENLDKEVVLSKIEAGKKLYESEFSFRALLVRIVSKSIGI